MVWVYFLKESGTNFVKIGYAADLEQRIRGIQTGNPRELVLIGLIPVANADGARAKEKRLYSSYHHGPHWKKGEWFDLPVADIRKIVKTYGRRGSWYQGAIYEPMFDRVIDPFSELDADTQKAQMIHRRCHPRGGGWIGDEGLLVSTTGKF